MGPEPNYNNNFLELDSHPHIDPRTGKVITNTNASVSQTIDLSEGGQYNFGFDFSGRKGGNPVITSTGLTIDIQTSTGFVLLTQELNASTVGFNSFDYSFHLCLPTQVIITFTGIGIADGYGALIDNVDLNYIGVDPDYVYVLNGTDKADTLQGSPCKDLITAKNGDDVVYGGDGDDTIYGGGNDDLVVGGRGNDVIYGGDDNDSLGGGLGNDLIYGNTGSDTVRGYIGNDTIYGGESDDTIYGGVDEADLAKISGGRLTDNDLVYGGGGNDLIYGLVGDDTLFGDSGNDKLDGGRGNDAIDGGLGDDRLFGGRGNDTIYGGDGNDSITAGVETSTLDGQSDDDSVVGGSGNDTIQGMAGNDTLLGGEGNDRLFGNSNDDILRGGVGDDTLRGGMGNDLFVFITGNGNDTIEDFQNGLDKIDVSGAGITSFGNLTITATAGNVIIVVADGSITLTGVKIGIVDTGDFIFSS